MKNMNRVLSLLVLVFVMTAAFAGSANAASQPTQLEPYEVVWYYDGNGAQADVEAVQNEMNKITVPAINATVKLIAVDWGNFDQKMQMAIVAGEKFDLCFTASWANNWLANISKGAYVELTDELLNQYAPTILAEMPEPAWEALKVDGRLYTLYNPQLYSIGIDLAVRKDLAEKYGFDPKTVTKLDDLNPFFEKILAGETGVYGYTNATQLGNLSSVLGYEEVTGRDLPGVVVTGDDTLTVVNQYELPAVADTYKTFRDWYLKGYTRKDAATYGGDDLKDGKSASRVGGGYKPGGDVEQKGFFGGRDVIDVPFGPALISSGSFSGTMTAVSITSKDVGRALMYLDLVWKDKDLFNLIVHGIEGKHHTKDADGFVTMIPGAGYDYSAMGWMFGPAFNENILAGQSKTLWEETRALNEQGVKSALFGFNFDPTPVKNEIAKIESIRQEYGNLLMTGAVDPETVLPDFIARMKDAGSEKVIAEAQAQIDAWKASK